MQGRASALHFPWSPHAWHIVWAWHGAQQILSERMILMEQRMFSIHIYSSCSDLVFNETQSLLFLDLSCLPEALEEGLGRGPQSLF